MLEIYASGWRDEQGDLHPERALQYDSRLPDVALQELKVTKALNKGGTATITVPPMHPLFNRLLSFYTDLGIYRDGRRLFRGRPLYPADTFELLRTFTCEGERCFLQDAIIRGRQLYRDEATKELTDKDLPGGGYLYQASPEEIFRDVVAEYNAQVDEFKRFEVGTIDVKDPNSYVRLENGEPESAAVVIDKLIERCGGYTTFTDTEGGKRAIHWTAQIARDPERQRPQDIVFGDNLLDFSRTTANTELATVIVPHGAVLNEETGERLTIKDVNGGRDYIVASEEVIALRGYIWKAVTWDDVTDANTLRDKAEAYLAECSQMLTTLTLTALDLSIIDKTVDSFELGDIIKVYSNPHGLKGETYQLTEMTLDLLNPQNDTITLGKTVASLTGADVVATMQASDRLQKVTGTVRKAYTVNDAKLSQMEQTFRSEIEQIPSRISLSVSGSLGGTASITMSVNGAQTSVGSLDLSGVRTAFANDTSAVTVSAGTITFNSGTLIINSSKCQLTAAGKLTVEDAVVNGEITTLDGSYKTQLDNGSLKLYYASALCGTINTKYWSGASTEGVSLRVEEAGQYLMFSHYDETQGSGYTVDYYLNAGWSPEIAEKHVFQTSVRFLDDVHANRTHIKSLRLYNGTQAYLVGVNSNGQLTCSKL